MKDQAIKNGQLRIIGGKWRSRKVTFLDTEGLRPTPDRVRETLFNWLAPYIEGANTLDLFTGSGALSIEALSRGAACATLLDVNSKVIDQLRVQLQLLNCENSKLVNQDATQFLQPLCKQPFDIVFLDPPFRQNLLERSCALLAQNGWLTNQAWIYIESEIAPSQFQLPTHWQLYKEKKAGQVFYALWQAI